MLPLPNHSAEQRRLLTLYNRLDSQDRAALFAFAEFLATRNPPESPAAEASLFDPPPAQPKQIPRPNQESVVAAIKRLSESYFMLDTKSLFNETTSLMTSHIMQGRAAVDVIDDLEHLFAERYRRFLSDEG